METYSKDENSLVSCKYKLLFYTKADAYYNSVNILGKRLFYLYSFDRRVLSYNADAQIIAVLPFSRAYTPHHVRAFLSEIIGHDVDALMTGINVINRHEAITTIEVNGIKICKSL